MESLGCLEAGRTLVRGARGVLFFSFLCWARINMEVYFFSTRFGLAKLEGLLSHSVFQARVLMDDQEITLWSGCPKLLRG